MKHLRVFESFVNEEAPFDPTKFKVAAEMIAAKIGKPKTESGLSFPEIKEVFGREDYNLRYLIAQMLFLVGKNYFPTNKDHSKDIQKFDKENGLGMYSYYTGEAGQNMIMKKVGKGLLSAIKPLVMKMLSYRDRGMSSEENKYFEWEAPKMPDVLKIKAVVDRLSKTEFPM